MNRKQFLVLMVVLVVLLGVGAWVQWSDNGAWKQADSMAGKKLLPALTAISVAEIGLRDGAGEVHLVKKGDEWTVRERADFPADVSRIADLLAKVVELRITQTEKVAEDKRAGFELAEPKPGPSAGSNTAGQGTQLELKDAAGKPLATLLLGKVLTKRGMVPSNDGSPPREGDVPYGRYVQATGLDTVAVVSEPMANAQAKPAVWLANELVRVDPAKSITAIGPNGDTRWTLTKDEKRGVWGWKGDPQPDPQKAQDVVSSLYLISIKDVVVDPAKLDTGLAKPVTIRADTPEGVVYTLKIGSKADEEGYYMTLAVSGEVSKTRPPMKDEKPEDKAKNDKAYADELPKMVQRVEKEKKYANWTYKLPKYNAELLIRDHAQLLPEKKPDAKKK